MKVKIINGDLEDYNKEFKVRRINYDQVIVNYPTKEGMKKFLMNDISLISEGIVDDLLIENKELLKIKLHRGVSVFFYKTLKEDLEEVLEEDLETINLLKDNFKQINNKGYWQKDILMIINEKYPINIKAIGRNFKKEDFKLEIQILNEEQFLEIYEYEIDKLKGEIEIKNISLDRYFLALKQIKIT